MAPHYPKGVCVISNEFELGGLQVRWKALTGLGASLPVFITMGVPSRTDRSGLTSATARTRWK